MKHTIIALLIFNVLCTSAFGGHRLRSYLDTRTEISEESFKDTTDNNKDVHLQDNIHFKDLIFLKSSYVEVIFFNRFIKNHISTFIAFNIPILINAPPLFS